jgi:murein DD-endopeptidase MepM/ murein hydrolase activator NlpD
MTFPLRERPAASYHEPPQAFGSPRDGGARSHAGCDLYAPAGIEILAIEAGTVTRGCCAFYDVVFALEVTSASGLVIRYGEIAAAAPGIRLGSQVVEGQVIAHVGKMETVAQAMLHLEMFAGTAQGPLTDRENPPFMRRADLQNPTAFLDACQEVTRDAAS